MNERESDVLRAVRRLIAQRGLQDGDRLPPEREMSALLGIGRRALREALGYMEGNAELWRGVGRGTYLGSRPARFDAGAQALSRDASPADIAELRWSLEPSIAELAAVKATADDLRELENCVRKHESTRDDAAWRKWDHRFHHLIVKATRNPALISLVEGITVLRGRPGARTQLLDAPARQMYAMQHRHIFEAIAARDPHAANRAMRAHLADVQRLLLRK